MGLAIRIQRNFPLSGTRSKARFTEFLLGQLLGAAIDGALTVRVKGVTTEDDRVAVEAEAFAKMKNGKTCQNRYHFLCEVRTARSRRYANISTRCRPTRCCASRNDGRAFLLEAAAQ
jgi:ketosteroid isomerase-like protein